MDHEPKGQLAKHAEELLAQVSAEKRQLYEQTGQKQRRNWLRVFLQLIIALLIGGVLLRFVRL